MSRILLSIVLALALGRSLPSYADVGRCAQASLSNWSAPVVVDPARLSGTSRRPPPSTHKEVRVNVLVSASQSIPADKSIEVRLIDQAGRRFTAHAEPSPRGLLYSALVRPGMYTVEVAAARNAPDSVRQLSSPLRRALLDQDVNELDVHLGKKGQDFLRVGQGIVPFTPSSSVAVVTSSVAKARSLLPDIDAVLKGVPGLRAPVSVVNSLRSSVILLDLGDGRRYADVADRLRLRLGTSVRVGMAIDLVPGGHFRVLDNRYVLRFSPTVRDEVRARVLQESDLVVFKRYRRDPDLMIAAFGKESYRQNTATIECLVAEGVLLTGEPDLISHWEVSGAVPTGWPNDPRFPYQIATHANFDNQSIGQAWDLLFDNDTQIVASPLIHVGLIDNRIDPTAAELACQIAGRPQIEMCWDPSSLTACSGPIGENTHGMEMLGIIAACTNNGKGIAGIAPGVRINAVSFEMPGLLEYYSGQDYSDMLLWMGGESEPCMDASPLEDVCHWPTIVPADVINNSYFTGTWSGWKGEKIELPELIASAFETLTTYGRNGKGTILVYAAGNMPTAYPTEVIAPAANDVRTIGVSNCYFDGQEERLFQGDGNDSWSSDIGDKVDVCADGQAIETISAGCPDRPSDEKCLAGGTSAATATVTGVVALMLTANPDLTSKDVKDLLAATADKIDLHPVGHASSWDTSSHSTWYGAGRVNARAAVQAALDKKSDPPPSGGRVGPN